MSVSAPYAIAVWRRNAAMYRRTWKWNILPNFFEPVFYLFSIGIGVGAYVSEMGGMSYIAFLAPGLVCVATMNGASFEVTYNIYVRLIFEKAYDASLRHLSSRTMSWLVRCCGPSLALPSMGDASLWYWRSLAWRRYRRPFGCFW